MSYDFYKATKRLESKSSLYSKKITQKLFSLLLICLKEYSVIDLQKIRHNKFILKQDFYQIFGSMSEYKVSKIAEDQVNRFFKLLLDDGVIDKTSESFTMQYEIARINKYFSFLDEKYFYITDMIEDFQQHIYSRMNNKTIKEIEIEVFILLHIFLPDPWKKYHIKEARYENNFFIDNNIFQVFKDTNFQSNIGYMPLMIKNISGDIAIRLKDFMSYVETGVVFVKEYDVLRDESNKIIYEFFQKKISKYILRNALIFNSIVDIGPLNTALKYKKIKSVPLSISEIHYLYPGEKEAPIVPLSLLEIESSNLRIIQSHFSDEDDFESDVENNFDFNMDIKPLFEFKISQESFNILDFNDGTIKMKYIEIVILQFQEKLKITKNASLIMIINYIMHLFKRVIGKEGGLVKIKFNTALSYMGLLRKYFFNNYDDLENMDWAKLRSDLNHLSETGYSKSSLNKLAGQIKSFLEYNNKETEDLVFTSNYMQKSLVFMSEIDNILNLIEDSYNNLPAINKKDKRGSKNIDFFMMQDKVFILLAYYTGLRKNELRTRLIKDIYKDIVNIYDMSIVENCYTIDVNLEGLRSQKKMKGFKSVNAVRKVNFHIPNQDHADIINMFIDESKKKGERYLFKNREFDILSNSDNLDRTIYKSAIDENRLDYLNGIIKSVTRRYCTIHSLRHSFVTNKIYNITNIDSFNTALLNFSIEVGHRTIGTTFLNYGHTDLMRLKGFDNA